MPSLVYIFMLLLGLLASGSLAQDDTYDLIVGPIEWTGVLDEAKGPVTLVGPTLEDIEAQAQALGYSILDPASAALVAERDDAKMLSINCGGPLGDAEWRPLMDGVEYLRKIKGTTRLGPGPRKCFRVSCSYGAAIYTCNDNSVHTEVAWEKVANMAFDTMVECRQIGTKLDWVHGQNFEDRENWNVVVGGDSC